MLCVQQFVVRRGEGSVDTQIGDKPEAAGFVDWCRHTRKHLASVSQMRIQVNVHVGVPLQRACPRLRRFRPLRLGLRNVDAGPVGGNTGAGGGASDGQENYITAGTVARTTGDLNQISLAGTADRQTSWLYGATGALTFAAAGVGLTQV